MLEKMCDRRYRVPAAKATTSGWLHVADAARKTNSSYLSLESNSALSTEELLYIDPVECIDCGACVPVCPVSAIFALDDLPEKWNAFTERNAKYFGR